MFSNIFTVLASAFTAWTFFRYVILIDVRIDENSFKIIYDLCKNNKIILLEEEFTHEKKYPIVFTAICFLKGCPCFYLTHEERLMTAGWTAKDYVTKIILFRTSYKKFKEFLKSFHEKNTSIPVDTLIPYQSDKIGQLKSARKPIITNNLCLDFENEIKSKIKTSAIFYGNPGNGKTSFVKYLAFEYRLPIKIITLSPDWNNYELLLLFSQIPNDCIVLFEDFDNYFNCRKCLIGEDNKNVKFTFDIILNALDGIYNTYENVIFIMTVNDLSKVDNSLKDRPSRFKYVIEFSNPNIQTILDIFGSDDKAKSLLGMNLDQILTVKQYQDRGFTFEESIKKISK